MGLTKKKNRWNNGILSAVVENGKTVGDIINSWEQIPVLSFRGGRGGESDAYSGSWPLSGNTDGRHESDFPARFNQRTKNTADTLERFKEKHASDNLREHGITVDERGYVTSYVHGSSGAVAISAQKGEMVYHNHPSSGLPAFSKEDIMIAASNSSRGIVASSSKVGRDETTAKYAGDYSFTKNQNFNASGFMKELNTAHIRGKDYNDAVSKWLGNKNRQRKYGYKFSFTPAKS